MNNPISDLYVKFMETIEPYIKKALSQQMVDF